MNESMGRGWEAEAAAQAAALQALAARLDTIERQLRALEDRSRITGEGVASIRTALKGLTARLEQVHSPPCPLLLAHGEDLNSLKDRLQAQAASRWWSLLQLLLAAFLGALGAGILHGGVRL